MTLTSSLCRSARALLGWTIDELAGASGVGVSTIISFEAGRRVPIRSNQMALERAFVEAGVIFLEGDMNEGRGLKLTKSTEALCEFLLIGDLKESRDARIERVQKRIAQFREDARTFYDASYGDTGDNLERVRNHLGKLRDRVDEEIRLRLKLRWDDEPTRLLEPVADLLHGKP